jgi:hypothetical protein
MPAVCLAMLAAFSSMLAGCLTMLANLAGSAGYAV